MSGFRRTTRGLNNQHLFYDVDLVIFLEGGNKSYTKEEVYAGNFHSETEDIIFWRNIFTKFNSERKIKFKSVGSKTTVKEIASDIVNGQLTTVYVAMDNEFDEILQQRIEHPNVYYTHGYSWENDIWNHQIIKAVIEELTAIEIDNNDIEKNFQNFKKQIKLAVFADGYLFKKNLSFFPRKTGYLFCVDCVPVDLPSVKYADLENRMIEKGLKKSTLYSFGQRHSIDPIKFCYGHLLADYCCQVISHYIRKRHLLTNVSNNIMYRMGLRKFFQSSFDSGNIYDYYSYQFRENER